MNNQELTHYGVVGMKWGKRKAQASERMALRKASAAITDKRKESFLKVAEKHKNKAADYDKQMADYKTKKALNKNKNNTVNSDRTKKFAKVGATTAISILGIIGATKILEKELFKE